MGSQYSISRCCSRRRRFCVVVSRFAWLSFFFRFCLSFGWQLQLSCHFLLFCRFVLCCLLIFIPIHFPVVLILLWSWVGCLFIFFFAINFNDRIHILWFLFLLLVALFRCLFLIFSISSGSGGKLRIPSCIDAFASLCQSMYIGHSHLVGSSLSSCIPPTQLAVSLLTWMNMAGLPRCYDRCPVLTGSWLLFSLLVETL